MKTKSVSHAMEQGADDAFGRGVFAANAAHVPTASRFAKAVPVHNLNSPKSNVQSPESSEVRSPKCEGRANR